MTEARGNENRRQVDDGAVVQLARELNIPQGEIASLYETELERMRSSAKVTAFLPVLVGKRLRRMLRDARRDLA